MFGWRLMGNATAIAPISVPEYLAEKGYTPVVAAFRLRDALLKFETAVRKAYLESRKPVVFERREPALHNQLVPGEGPMLADADYYELDSERPTIEVPSTGLTLNAIVDVVRPWFGRERRRISATSS